VFYDKLFRAGAFRSFATLNTGKWRVYRPWPEDEGGDLPGRRGYKAPPLIPQRFIEGKIAWEKRSERVFSARQSRSERMGDCTLPTAPVIRGKRKASASTCTASTKTRRRPAGTKKRGPRGGLRRIHSLVGSAARQEQRPDELMKFAKDEADKPEPIAVNIRASIFDNKYLPKKSVADRSPTGSRRAKTFTASGRWAKSTSTPRSCIRRSVATCMT
jgi:hypothetical protein